MAEACKLRSGVHAMNILAQPLEKVGDRSLSTVQPHSALDGDVIVLDGISWGTYASLADDLADRRSVRLTYDRGSLQLMSPLPEHEAYSAQLSQFVRAAAMET